MSIFSSASDELHGCEQIIQDLTQNSLMSVEKLLTLVVICISAFHLIAINLYVRNAGIFMHSSILIFKLPVKGHIIIYDNILAYNLTQTLKKTNIKSCKECTKKNK